MTRRLVSAACVVAGAVHLAMSFAESASPRTSLRVGACTLSVEIADTPARRATGLSHTTALRADGLLLRWDRPGLHAIWMRDMQYPLDLAWIDQDAVVRALMSDVAPCRSEQCDIYAPPGVAATTAVLETPAGRLGACGVRVGSSVVLAPVPQENAQ